MRRSLSALLVGLACAVLAPTAAAQPSLSNPPPGANDFSCEPSAAHPEPVVLVHGLGANMSQNWSYISPQLAERGYCVFALTYGMDPRLPPGLSPGGIIPVQDSAPELAAFVDRVLAETGAAQVDLVGHSEGTFMPQFWLKQLGGAPKVDQYVAMTPLYDGTELGGVSMLRDLLAPTGLSRFGVNLAAAFCGSCPQFLAGSEMVELLKEGGIPAPGVEYTTIMTKYDELVIPYTSGVIDDPGHTNIVVQDVCANDISEHAAVAYDPVVARIILNQLDPASARNVSCAGLPPLAPPPAG